MKLFGKCLWHNWIYKEVYYDCSDICIWSNGTNYYRQCKDCIKTQIRSDYEYTYHTTKDNYTINLFKKEGK